MGRTHTAKGRVVGVLRLRRANRFALGPALRTTVVRLMTLLPTARFVVSARHDIGIYAVTSGTILPLAAMISRVMALAVAFAKPAVGTFLKI
jgi:hypothetical protein